MWVRSFSDASILWSYDVRQWNLQLPANKKLKEWLYALFDVILFAVGHVPICKGSKVDTSSSTTVMMYVQSEV